MGLRRERHQGRLPFEYAVAEDEGTVTAYGGLPLVVDTMRSLQLDDAIREHMALGERARKHDAVGLVEGHVLLMAAGGECLDDFAMLSKDKALSRLIDRELPSPETARRFLYEFHDETLIEAAKAALPAGEVSYVPAENALLQGLGRVQRDLVHAVAARGRAKLATLDIDGTIAESHKREAQEHFEGGRGYQPVVAIWAEQDLVVADEFRDGNVPAGKDTLPLTKRAFSSLPETVIERRFRADSAYYNEEQITWLDGAGIEFTISADMSPSLKAACASIAETEWKLLEERAEETVHVAEIPYVPSWKKSAPVVRYLGVRFTPVQGELFERGAKPKHLAVVTHRKGSVEKLLKWHWEKAGTIEHVHDVVKNELGGGVLPCEASAPMRRGFGYRS